jgi:hypothetical protein
MDMDRRVIRLPKLYPDRPWPRFGYILADCMALLWIAAWAYIGNALYKAMMALTMIAGDAVAIGHQVDNSVTQLQQSIATLPLVGSQLGAYLTPLHGISQTIIARGHNELEAIQRLAVLIGIVPAGTVALLSLLLYTIWRRYSSRGFRNLDRLLRTPGATAAATTMQVLATRALYALPYGRLLRYTPDPLADWREGRYENLARAAIAAEGLDVRRYPLLQDGPRPGYQPHPVPDRTYSRTS